jgi:hypothetical protein
MGKIESLRRVARECSGPDFAIPMGLDPLNGLPTVRVKKFPDTLLALLDLVEAQHDALNALWAGDRADVESALRLHAEFDDE